MPFYFREEKRVDDKRHAQVRAECDFCNKEKYVRKSWAYNHYRKHGNTYRCISCTRKRNIKIAQEANMSKSFVDWYIDLGLKIYQNEWSDKAWQWIGDQTGGREAEHSIIMCRDFVEDFIIDEVSPVILDCARHIKEGADDEIIALFHWEDELNARLYVALDSSPIPDYLDWA